MEEEYTCASCRKKIDKNSAYSGSLNLDTKVHLRFHRECKGMGKAKINEEELKLIPGMIDTRGIENWKDAKKKI